MMDIFFSFQNRYEVSESIDAVRTKLNNVISKPWYNFSPNISGKINDDDTFKLSPKFSIGALRTLGFVQSATYITGCMREENGKTVIEITTRPNFAFLAIFYFCIFLIVTRVIKMNVLTQLSFMDIFPATVVFGITIFILIIILRNRFEKVMNLQRKE